MASFNRVILLGNLTRDPELRHAPSGIAVAELRLAVSESRKDRQTGQTRESVCYVDVTVWDRQAENCQQFLVKGSQILVEGRLQMDEWKTPQGESRSKLRVRADRVQFMGAPRRSGEQTSTAGATQANTPSPGGTIAEDAFEADVVNDSENLPF
jgi:single-strand DNA-binding protein